MSNPQRTKIMKKLLFGALALVGILAVSCNKETEVPAGRVPSDGEKTTYTIKAVFSEPDDVRTAYADNKTFSWVKGDSVYVRCIDANNEYWGWRGFEAQNSGAETELVGELEDGWTPYDVAVYQAYKQVASVSYNDANVRVSMPISYHLDGYGMDADNEEPYYNSVSVPSDNPLSVLPLVGSAQEDGTLRFQTGVSILKANLTDVDPAATHVRFTAAAGYLGNYLMVKDGEIRMEESWASDQGQLYSVSFLEYYFAPVSDGKVSFYLPIPVGTLTKGSTIEVLDANDNVLFKKAFAKDVVLPRNKVVELAALSTKVEWVSLGTGKFGDHYHFNADYDVDVEIQQNAADPTEFRLVDPYAGYRELTEYEATGDEIGPDPYLVFRVLQKGERVNGTTVTRDDLVYFDAYYTGIIDDSYGVDPFLAHPSRWGNSFTENDWLRSIVVKYQGDGVTPANVQLAPIFFWLTDQAAGSGYWSGSNYLMENNIIEIKFPGAERIDLEASVAYLEIADSTPAQATAIVETSFSSAIASAKIVIAADETKAAEALANGTDVTTVTAAGECEVKLPANAPSGDYFVFMQTVVAEGLTAASNQLIMSDKFYYNNDETDLGLDLSVLFGSWTGDIIRNVSGQYTADTFSMTIEESDNPLSGDVLLTEIYGEPATIPVYGWFDGKTGTLTIAPDQPWAEFNEDYDVGMVDAQSPNKDLSFRYREDGTLYLQSCEFVAFYLYDKGTTTQSDYWWGYFYGNTTDYHLTMTKDESSTGSAPAALTKGTRSLNDKAVSKIGAPVREVAHMR